MARSVMESKCFICSAVFDAKLLPQHERECLMKLQDNLENITREVDTLLETDIESVQSATSTGSSEGSSRKTVRCYICGHDFSTHFINVHEKQCKRKWDSGVAKHEKLKKVSSLGAIFPSNDNLASGLAKDSRNINGMRKAQSVANVANREPKQAWNARLRNDAAGNAPKQSSKVKRTLKNNPRPASAYASLSTQDLRMPFASSNEVSIFDDTNDDISTLSDLVDDDKATSMNDLSKPTRETTSRSKFNPCQFCGKIFSIHSITIHEKKCRERGQKENSCKSESPANGLSVSVLDISNSVDKDDWLKNKNLENVSAASVDKLNLLELHDANILSPLCSPKFLPCHVCGKPFGSKSLRIHIPQCEKKWEREHKSNDTEKTRLPRNNRPKRLFHSETNLASKYEDNNLKPSIWYGNRVSNHTPSSVRNGLNKNATSHDRNPTKAIQQNNKNSKAMVRSEPRTTLKRPTSGVGSYVACQFCNNYYGSASVKIHELKCGMKFQKDETKLNSSAKSLKKSFNASAKRLFGPRR